jgi:pantothenate kinase-related protein Tda10
MLGNMIQNRADQVPGDSIVYAISDRDAYRRTLELYLRDALLTRTEQLLLWEERRRLGISDAEHEILLKQLLNQWKRQGKAVTIDRFSEPEAGGADPV